MEQKWRMPSSGKHKSKVLIEIRKEDPEILKSPHREIKAIPKLYFDPNKTYILVGGLGGVGLELTDWLIRRGATKIILNSRRTITTGYQSYCFKKWSQYEDVVIDISTDDTTNIEGASKLIAKAEELGPVGGIFNMALVLRDALLPSQTKSKFEEVFRVKIVSGQNMDIVSREHCKHLDYFVVFSSIACGRGNSGQINYGMANSALERLCEKRRRENFPALAIQWGPIADVGALVGGDIQTNKNFDVVPQSVTSCFNSLEKFIIQSTIVGSSSVLGVKSGTSTARATRTPAEAVAHIMGIKNMDLVDKSLTLSQLGQDSLMLAETKQTLYRNYQLELETDEIRDLTLDYLISLEINEGTSNPSVEMKEIDEYVPQLQSILLVEEVIVKLNFSKSHNKNIFLLHPIEGNVNVLIPVSKKIKANVYGIQWARGNECDTIQNIASSYIQHVRNIQPKGPYFFCGYSFGGVVTFEMGLQLESEGEIVNIVSIEGSPKFVKNTMEPAFVRLGGSMEKSKLAILRSFCSYFDKVDQDTVVNCLEGLQSYDKKLEAISRLISNQIGIDSDEIAISEETFFKRCHAAFHYEPKSVFNGKVLLIRRINNPYETSETYDLQKECQQTVTVVKLDGDHTTIVQDDNAARISDIINNYFTFS